MKSSIGNQYTKSKKKRKKNSLDRYKFTIKDKIFLMKKIIKGKFEIKKKEIFFYIKTFLISVKKTNKLFFLLTELL